MILIVGLGNPGEKYRRSRHNVGFMVVEALARKFQISNFKFQIDKEAKVEIIKTSHGKEKIILAKPQTMMNASGFAIKSLITNYSITNYSDLWVIHDDLDLPLGKIKIRMGGGTAGHHGLDSIVEQLRRADFIRFRLGIGRPVKGDKWEVGGGKLVSQNVKHKEVEDYILTDFEAKERDELRKMIKKAVKAIEAALEQGLERAMNRFNLK